MMMWLVVSLCKIFTYNGLRNSESLFVNSYPRNCDINQAPADLFQAPSDLRGRGHRWQYVINIAFICGGGIDFNAELIQQII